MFQPVTKKQSKILKFIIKELEAKGYPPTIREIGKAMGISTLRGVTCHLDALEKKGYIERNSTPRGIRILHLTKDDNKIVKSKEMIKLPLLGRVAAGSPILAEQNIEDWIPVPKTLTKGNKDVFLLKIHGDSMVGDHILDGDIVIVKPHPTAENGDIVVAVIDNEATVKRFYRKNRHIQLRPANPKYKSITLTEDFRINGKVIGLLRA